MKKVVIHEVYGGGNRPRHDFPSEEELDRHAVPQGVRLEIPVRDLYGYTNMANLLRDLATKLEMLGRMQDRDPLSRIFEGYFYTRSAQQLMREVNPARHFAGKKKHIKY